MSCSLGLGASPKQFHITRAQLRTAQRRGVGSDDAASSPPIAFVHSERNQPVAGAAAMTAPAPPARKRRGVFFLRTSRAGGQRRSRYVVCVTVHNRTIRKIVGIL